MNLILDDIYTWSVYSKEKQLNFNGWYIVNHHVSFGNVVIDPPKPDLAIPYNTIAGTTLTKNNKFISIINQKYSNKDKTTNIKTNMMTAM